MGETFICKNNNSNKSNLLGTKNNFKVVKIFIMDL